PAPAAAPAAAPEEAPGARSEDTYQGPPEQEMAGAPAGADGQRAARQRFAPPENQGGRRAVLFAVAAAVVVVAAAAGYFLLGRDGSPRVKTETAAPPVRAAAENPGPVAVTSARPPEERAPAPADEPSKAPLA